MNLFCRAKTTRLRINQSRLVFSSTGSMLQISDRKRESSRALEDICKGESFNHFNLAAKKIFQGRFTKLWGRKAKKPRAKGFGARVPEGCSFCRYGENMKASGHGLALDKFYFTSESISSVAYEPKGNGVKRQTKIAPENSKIQLRIIDFFYHSIM